MGSATVFRPPSPGGGGDPCSNAVPSLKPWEMAGAEVYTRALFIGGGVRREWVLRRREGGLSLSTSSQRWIRGEGLVLPHCKGLQRNEGSELTPLGPLLQAEVREVEGRL